MNTTEKISKYIDEKFSEYKKPVTELSKTDENDFIINDTLMIDWDEISKLHEGDDLSSVDAIYCYIENNTLTLYFFEFKNLSLHEKFFDAKKQLSDLLNDLDKCVFSCCYPKELKEVKKKVISKKIISLKTKPLESLILLNNLLNDAGISSEEITSINKEYYIISETPVDGNKSNWHRGKRNKEIFGFIDKIKPFPFSEINHLNERRFLSLINTLQKNNEYNN